MAQNLIIFGHSHVWSVRRAAQSWSQRGTSVTVPVCGTKELPGTVVYPGSKGYDVLNPVIAALLYKAEAMQDATNTWLVSMAQGNYFNRVGMVTQDPPFDFVLDSQPGLPLAEGAVILPLRAVRTTLETEMQDFRSYARLMGKTAFRSRLIIVGPPPPPRGEAEIAALLAAEAAKKPAGQEAEAGTRITPSLVRLKLWHLQNGLAHALCKAQGILYLSGGLPGTQDADGFIRPDYIKDAVHANEAYARLLLDRLAAIAAGAGAAT